MAKYINRDAYIRYLSSRKAEFVDDFGQGWCAGIDTAISACEKFPAADVEPVRHGRWLTWEEQFPDSAPKKLNNLGVFCDKCHNHADNRTDYCPNCGAKMDG